MKTAAKAGCIVFALVLMLSFLSHDPAMDAAEDMDTVLQNRGYPQTLLNRMSPTAKISLYEKPELEFVGGTVTTAGSVGCEVFSEGGLSVGEIPTADLSLSWSISRNRENEQELFLTYSYVWQDPPAFRWQDPIAVSWDDSLFEMKDDSFCKIDGYDSHRIGGRAAYRSVQSSEKGYASGGNAGVTWYADLHGHDLLHPVDTLYGHGEFVLVQKADLSGSSTIYGHYIHTKAGMGIGISVPGFGELSVSGSGACDGLGSQLTISF